jgi:hypothetical protein
MTPESNPETTFRKVVWNDLLPMCSATTTGQTLGIASDLQCNRCHAGGRWRTCRIYIRAGGVSHRYLLMEDEDPIRLPSWLEKLHTTAGRDYNTTSPTVRHQLVRRLFWGQSFPYWKTINRNMINKPEDYDKALVVCPVLWACLTHIWQLLLATQVFC